MDHFKPQAQAVLWMDKGVLYGQGRKAFDQMPEALSYIAERGVRMAIVTLDSVETALKNLGYAGLLERFEKDAAGWPLVFSATAHTQRKPGDEGANGTTINTPLTQAFLAARKSMGTDHRRTIAVVGHTLNVRHARYAGLPVVGHVSHPHYDFDTAAQGRAEMLHQGAFYAASAAIDLPSAVMHFRPSYEAKWQPVAAPGG